MTDGDPIEPHAFDRYVPRRDVSAVAPQGERTAWRCPMRVQFDAFPPADVERAPLPAGAQLRADERATFVATVVEDLLAHHLDAVTIEDDLAPEDAQDLTFHAMNVGVPLIVDGWLPSDLLGRRSGRPPLLVRAERRPDGRWAYHPILIERHLTLGAGPRDDEVPRALVSTTERLAHLGAERHGERASRNRTDDLLRLAHHHRLLEANGRASADLVGGVIGTERLVVWHRLDEPVVRQLWDGSLDAREAALQRYDVEFSYRLDVLAAAAAGESLVEPVLVKQCEACPWRTHCLPALQRADSTSLLPGVDYRAWHALRRLGVTSRAALARVDHRSALVRDAVRGVGADLSALVEAAELVVPSTPVEDLLVPAGSPDAAAPSAAAVAVLVEHEVARACDLVALDPVAVALADQPIRALAGVVHGARVIAEGRVVELRHGVAALELPSADVEIDIDMENAVDGTVYLWGALEGGTYHPFVSWATPSRLDDAEVFAAFWDWLQARRTAAASAGRTLAVYCWYQGAEAGALRRGAAAAAELLGRAEAPAEVEELLAGDQWVDLFEVFTRQLVTGTGAGLKVVATLAGFRWRDDDPSGEASMAWHAEAVGGDAGGAAEAARTRLLAYNEDDVRATAAVRAWLRSRAL